MRVSHTEAAVELEATTIDGHRNVHVDGLCLASSMEFARTNNIPRAAIANLLRKWCMRRVVVLFLVTCAI